ncbi:LPS export ABC transporter permease LptF [Methylomonas sp. SURF-2]|uniref:Lipopolysaccharide export system permease protein LptF n=1 Tax=Methylomonas subterranea TaxID=2952225 RepID=A0ABT1TJF1_9GAMM|nr:LPS export ABC transporter permease LptF [Methylomonas sp. SURF-2]MCQ8105597.1 LPS export ABC transporter permease LptF [Methylomonas sp. SURF-2]
MSNERSLPSAGRPIRLFTVLDRMIFMDLLKTVVSVLAVLVVIIVSRKFIKILAQAIEGNIASETVLALLGLKIVIAAATFLPAALFMSVLMVLGRMHREQEMAAIASAGGGVFTIYRAVFGLVVPLSVCAAGLSMYAAPWAEARSEQLLHLDGENADIRSIAAGRFSEYSSGELIFYTENVAADGKMSKVFVQNKQGDKLGVVNAEQGRLEYLPGGLYLILEHGERVQGIPGRRDYTVETFDEYAVLVEKKTVAFVPHLEALPTEKLWQSQRIIDIAHIQDRLNAPMGVLLLAFLGVPLAKSSPRGGVYGSVLVAFGIYFAYANLQRVNHSWVISEIVPVWLGYFWVEALLLMVGLGMLVRLYSWKWVVLKLTGKVTL